MKNQLSILSESLDKKIQVLEEIQAYNREQEQAFSSDKIDLGSFDRAVEEKGRLIDSLTRLDEGFETLYDRVAQELKDNRAQYAEEIRELKRKISTITEMNVSIQAQEQRNKRLVEQYFARERQGLERNRKASKAAYDYYKKINHTAYVPSQFYDSKQ